MHNLTLSVFVLAGMLVASTAQAQKPEKIYSVEEVSLYLLKSEPPKLLIVAKGKSATPNWTNPTLKAVVYVQPPEDGIYDYDFIARKPKGIVAQVITDIDTTILLREIPEGLKGIRVHASDNAKEALLSTAKEVKAKAFREMVQKYRKANPGKKARPKAKAKTAEE
ncbi:Hypothetical protein PBC10988_20910 [Planctomycetales bacterium 10988]|nr:Hypothetical protein PBC10988_20910 [Planctomycetales bacterium 10988]